MCVGTWTGADARARGNDRKTTKGGNRTGRERRGRAPTEGGGQRALLAAGRPVRCGRRTAAVVVWCPDCRPVATVVAPPSHRGGGRRQWDGGVGPRDLAEASASYIVGIVQWRRFEGRARGRLCGLSLGLGRGKLLGMSGNETGATWRLGFATVHPWPWAGGCPGYSRLLRSVPLPCEWLLLPWFYCCRCRCRCR